jgi:hypothetical protein
VREAGRRHRARTGLHLPPGSISGSTRYVHDNDPQGNADNAAKTDGQRCGEDRRVATVPPKLRWVSAARCAAGRSTPNRDDQPNSETTPRNTFHANEGERAAEVLCLYAALVDRSFVYKSPPCITEVDTKSASIPPLC